MLNNREWAGVIWLVILAIFLAKKGQLGAILRGFVRALPEPLILLAIAALLIYSIALGLVGRWAEVWNTALAKDTIVWFLIGALPLLFTVTQSTQRHYFRRVLLHTLRLTAFLEFLLNLFVLNLVIELLLVPATLLILLIPMVGRRDRTLAPAVAFANVASSVIGVAICVFVLVKLVLDWDEVANITTVQSLALPIWLTVGLLPFIYASSLWTNYSSAFARIDIATNDRRVRLRAKCALALTLHLRTGAAGSFAWPWVKRAVDAESWGVVRSVVKEYLANQRH